MWDMREKEYIFDHGWTINSEGLIEIPEKDFKNHQYTGKSLRNPDINTLMLPSINGCALILEKKHFIIV